MSKMIKISFVIFLFILLLFLVVLYRSYTLSENIVCNDLIFVEKVINLSNTIYSDDEVNKKVEEINNNILKKFYLESYDKLKNLDIFVNIDKVIELYTVKDLGDIDSSGFKKPLESIIQIENEISLKELRNIEFFEYNENYYEIIDISDIMNYNYCVSNNMFCLKYMSYNVDRNKVIVTLRNEYFEQNYDLVFTHTFFGKIEKVQVM